MVGSGTEKRDRFDVRLHCANRSGTMFMLKSNGITETEINTTRIVPEMGNTVGVAMEQPCRLSDCQYDPCLREGGEVRRRLYGNSDVQVTPFNTKPAVWDC